MKKIIILVLFTFSLTAIAQDDKEPVKELEQIKKVKSKKYQGTNELRVNAFLFIYGAFEATYEKIINEESSFGITAGASFDKTQLNYNYSIEPFYRYYFGNKPAAGFFLEGYGSLNSRDYYNNNFNNQFLFPTTNVVTATNFGVGIGLGGKFITRNNIVFEINVGLGRNLTKNNFYENGNGFAPTLNGRGGISVGYRF